jgi:hypothetical protein
MVQARASVGRKYDQIRLEGLAFAGARGHELVEGGLDTVVYTGTLDVPAGSAIITHQGEWVRYSTPQGAEYIAVCLPAFSPATVHRDA